MNLSKMNILKDKSLKCKFLNLKYIFIFTYLSIRYNFFKQKKPKLNFESFISRQLSTCSKIPVIKIPLKNQNLLLLLSISLPDSVWKSNSKK